ncbi:t-SNARE [Xylariaceae sp. FL0804]|nr:t-SNARE [Xylariaceae sp. FL0804]
MAQYGYGGQANPFDDRNGAAAPAYGGGLPSRPSYGGGNSYRNQAPAPMSPGYNSNVEMSSLTNNASSMGARSPNPLAEVSEINNGIDVIDRNLEQLKMLQQRALDDSDNSASSNTNRQLEALSSETMAHYRQLVERVRQLKSNPESQQRFGQQVARVDRKLKDAIRSYQSVESNFRKRTQDQMARQYRIVRPDADESEVQAAVEDPSGGQVFQQALMQSNRRGQAQSVLNAVQDRHAQLQKIEQQMTELAQLFQDMDTLVIQQEVAVANIEQKGEEVVENLDRGNVEIGTAVNTARATRKKKWICLGISVAIILIIVIIVVVYFLVTNPPSGGNKRSLEQRDTSLLFETGPAPALVSRINAEARRWVVEAKAPTDNPMIS